jgi:SPBc2 prophage-derived thioredoxin-like protein yosR
MLSNLGEGETEMKKLIKFEKADCNPCVMVSDLLDKSGVEYEKINPFNNPELAMKYKVRTVPTTILLDQDEEIKRTIGFNPEELKELIAMI